METPSHVISDEEKKLIALARPPKSLTHEVESLLVSIIRDASVDHDWEAANEAIVKSIPSEAAHINLMCAVYVVIKRSVESNVVEDHSTFIRALNEGMFDVSVLSRGLSWFLTFAISEDIKEDFPLAFSRFTNMIIHIKEINFTCVLRDVLTRTANYLDALHVELSDSDEVEWEGQFIDVCATLAAEWKKQRTLEMPSPEEVLNTFSAVKQRPLLRDVAPDFLMELMQHGYFAEKDVRLWLIKHKEQSKFKQFVELVYLLIPELSQSISTAPNESADVKKKSCS